MRDRPASTEIAVADIPASPDTRTKVLQLLRYLRDFVALRSAVVRDVSSYAADGEVLWFSGMPHDRDCTSPAWGGGDEDDGSSWLSVRQQVLPPLPAVPAAVEPWIDEDELTNIRPDHEPQLRAVAFIAKDVGQSPVEQRLADHPMIASAWERYLPRWREWRVARHRAESIQRVYSQLFSIYQRQTKLGELYELIVGLGLLQWRRSSGSIRRHCFVANGELRFDRERGEIRLLCPAGGARLRLEDDMLEIGDRPPREHYETLKAHLTEWEDDLWSTARAETALKDWGRSLHADAHCELNLERRESIGDAPTVDLAPALILRKRGVQTTVKLYEEMIAQVDEPDDEPSFGLKRLVEDIDDDSAPGGGDHPEVIDNPFALSDGRIYFPKAANRDQREIIARLRRHRGILVQGPPGTGKSHTIANLVCHLLAEGKRVLVTSETPRALRVLKDKIPAALQPLCVSNLGGDADSFRELESCVNGITRRHAGWNRRTYDAAITEAEKELDQVQRQIAVLDRQIHELRKFEVEVHAAGGNRGTPSALARQVADRHAEYSWCVLDRDSPGTAPLSPPEFSELVADLRNISTELARELKLELPRVENLPDRNAFATAVEEIRRHEGAAGELEQWRSHGCFSLFLRAGNDWRQQFRGLLEQLIQKRTELLRRSHPWRTEALRDILCGRALRWVQIRKETAAVLEGVEPFLAEVDASQIEAPADYSDERLFHEVGGALELLRAGKRWAPFGLGFGPLAPYVQVKKACRINGISGATIPVLERLHRVLNVKVKLRRAWTLWSGIETENPGSALSRFAQLVDAFHTLEEAFEVHRLANDAGQHLMKCGAASVDWAAAEETTLLQVLEAAERMEALKRAEQQLERSAEVLRGLVGPQVHPLVERIRLALNERDPRAWAAAIDELLQLHQRRSQMERRDALLQRLEAGAHTLAGELRRTFSDEAWLKRAEVFTDAWVWARTNEWLREQARPGFVSRLEGERRQLIGQWEDAMSRVAEAKAWLVFLDRLSPKQSAALQAWTNAVRALGKGTGKSVRSVRLRQEARSYATEASTALPAWIMPRYKVVEMIRPEADTFDVVIVDEASQSGIDSLFLFHIGRQIVVVGDDQQISPNIGFIEAERIAALQNLHLRDVRHKVALDVSSSLYDNARIRFRAAVVLREHFRCMPEIIQFSNDLCYRPNGTPLDPLRTYSESRLDPVVTTFVPEGYREGSAASALNLAEAETIVEQVKKCLADPRYAHRSMGVISLQGAAQAQKIHQLLVSSVGAAAMEERDLVCGDAYDFQGDERDVIFLSLVAAPNERIGVLAKTSDHQRFNVAASRARDQLWLFHSAALEDLSPACVRYRLVDYMRAPRRMIDDTSETERFDSEFERHVYERIVARGFAVRPQVPVGDALTHRYRIDLVVEGIRGKLAVECDGDRWHGPERYESDMRRQRDLERAGWRFWRVRGGEFYRDPEAALATLWAELDSAGVVARAEQPSVKSATVTEPAEEALPPEEAAVPEENPELRSATLEEPVEPGTGWKVRSLPDPRLCTPEQIVEGFAEIIRDEGPVLCSRVYSLYLHAAGIGRLGQQIKTQLNRCMARAVRAGRFVQDRDDSVGQLDKTVRLPGTPAVIIRTGKRRRWDEVPRSELRALAQKFLNMSPHAVPATIVSRVYEAFGGERLRTDTARELQALLEPVFLAARLAPVEPEKQPDLFDSKNNAEAIDGHGRLVRLQVTPNAIRTGILNLDDGYVEGTVRRGEQLRLFARAHLFTAVVDPSHERPTLKVDSAPAFFSVLQLGNGDWFELREDDSGKWQASRTTR